MSKGGSIHEQVNKTHMEQSTEEIMRTALWQIANPIAHLQQEAEKEGGKLDGMGAISLAKDANWLQGIARKALE